MAAAGNTLTLWDFQERNKIADYVRGDPVRIKSAMKTVRVPLIAFTITTLGAQNVDLTDIDSIAFEFDVKATGEIEFSDIEFTP
jgi:hypothetical protein